MEYALKWSIYGVDVDVPEHIYMSMYVCICAYKYIYNFRYNLIENIYNAGIYISKLHFKEDNES